MIRVSFILPCYNVAPYFGRCIESIEHQDIPQAEYEVICVDDCSTDNTVEVIKEYQKQYPNIRLICHAENKNAGGARNTALDAAKGEYIWCIDPDDSIPTDVLGALIKKAEKNQLDILLFNLLYREEDGTENTKMLYRDEDKVLTGVAYSTKICAPKYLHYVTSHTCCIYRKAFLEKHNIRYPEIRSSQDVIFVWNAVLLAKRVSSVSTVCYNVFRRPNSTTGSKGKLKANAIISASLLYCNEVNRLRGINTEVVLDEDLQSEMQMTLDNDSRKVLHTTLKEQRLFYKELCHYAAMVDQYRTWMNRKTKKIMNYKLPYPIWQMVIWGYKAYEKIRK